MSQFCPSDLPACMKSKQTSAQSLVYIARFSCNSSSQTAVMYVYVSIVDFYKILPTFEKVSVLFV